MPPPPHLYLRAGLQRGYQPQLLHAALRDVREQRKHGVATILTLGHLAARSGISYQYLREVVAKNRDPYRRFSINKRSSTARRVISSPEPLLLAAQRWILRYVLDNIEPHDSCFSYRRGRSIKDCAERHVGAAWLVKADLHDFFHSVREPSVYHIFRSVGYSNLVAFELARLCVVTTGRNVSTTKAFTRYSSIPEYQSFEIGFLPQGAPTSGALSNLVMREFDRTITDYATSHNMEYTRYADDIVLSSAVPFSRARAERVLSFLRKTTNQTRFSLHEKKTRIVPPGARKIVVGLLVDDDSVRPTPEFRRRVDNHIWAVHRFGPDPHRQHRHFSSILGLVAHIDGLLAFAFDIDPQWAVERLERWRTALERHNSLVFSTFWES